LEDFGFDCGEFDCGSVMGVGSDDVDHHVFRALSEYSAPVFVAERAGGEVVCGVCGESLLEVWIGHVVFVCGVGAVGCELS
jgi:hypothetical protein